MASQTASNVLQIVSHDTKSELSPPMDFDYDLRTVPNPPREIRKKHTGVSRQLCEQLLEQPRFRATLEQAEADIRTETARRASLGSIDSEEEQRKQGGGGDEDDEEDDDDDDANGSPAVLRVGSMCGSGHHRSVAFAELLARKEWPEDWKVELSHRDLTEDVKKHKAKARRRASA